MRIAIVLVGRTVPGFNRIADSISRAFGARITTEMINFPITRSYRAGRRQFDAEPLLRDLARFAPYEADRTVILFREDIFAGRLNFVFGLAMGDACIVSTARLDPRFYGETDMDEAGRLFRERIVKEVLHELGHTFGLPHCDDKRCVMVFSDSIDDVDYKGKAFCRHCRAALYHKPIKDV